MRIFILCILILIFSACQSRGTEDDPIVVRLEHQQAVGVTKAFGGDATAIPKPPPPQPGFITNVIDTIVEFLATNKELSVAGALAAFSTIWYRRRKKIRIETEDNPQPTPDKSRASRKSQRNRRK